MKFHDVLKLLLEGDKRTELKKANAKLINDKKQQIADKLIAGSKPAEPWVIEETNQYKKDLISINDSQNKMRWKINEELKRIINKLKTTSTCDCHSVILRKGSVTRCNDTHVVNDCVLLWYKVEADHKIVLYRIGTHPAIGLL